MFYVFGESIKFQSLGEDEHKIQGDFEQKWPSFSERIISMHLHLQSTQKVGDFGFQLYGGGVGEGIKFIAILLPVKESRKLFANFDAKISTDERSFAYRFII